jgi:hypothetical protein
MSKRDTKKAAKTRAATKFVFSDELSFHEVFPEIGDMCITVTETEGIGKAVFDTPKLYLHSTRVYGTNIGDHIECHSPFCVNGGFSIREILRAMVRIHEQSKQGTILCKGSDDAAKRRRKNLPCNHSFQFKIAVKYKDEVAGSIVVDAYRARYDNNHENKSNENSWYKNSSTPPPQSQPE